MYIKRCADSTADQRYFIAATIMNDSEENVAVLLICKVANVSFAFQQQFPNKDHERNHIVMIVFNSILLFSTISLNGMSVITIRKSSQLRGKVCYFVILLQSAVDMGVGFISIPFFVYGLITPILNTVNCIPMILASRVAYLPLGLSIATLSGMAIERYIGVLHPFYYQAKVTKKRVLAYVCGHGLVLFSLLALSVRDKTPMKFYVKGSIVVVFAFTGFAYTRIFLVTQKLIRSQKRPAGDGNQVKRRIMRESRRARSCFLVILCFFLFVVPFALSPVLNAKFKGTYDSRVYFKWALTSIILNSNLNSVIFFWTKTLLRKEAVKILHSLFS